MRRLWLILACLMVAGPVQAALSEQDLTRAVARPVAGAVLPGVAFSDLSGRRDSLTAFAQGRPLVLIFADFTCRNICSPGLTITAARLRETGLKPGRDYRLAVIGIDPRDTTADARHFAHALDTMPEVARVTSVLQGDDATIRHATGALGYGYVYDAQNDQFAHDASIYVFDAQGRLAAVLPEIGLLVPPLKAALTQKGGGQSWVVQAARLCYGFAAAHGRFARWIVPALQVFSALLLLTLGGVLWQGLRKRPA